MWFVRVFTLLSAALCVTAAQSWEQSAVVPLRLDPKTEAFTAEEREKEAEMRVYRLDVFGKRLILQLEPDQTFLAPGFVFHIVGSPESVQQPTAEPERGCFYSGKVNGDEHSAAALNLCHGLRGGFYYEGEEYFIQPLNETDYNRGEAEEEVHTVRRRKAAGLAEEGSSKCGVNEDEPRVPKNLEKEERRAGTNSEQTGKPHSRLQLTFKATDNFHCPFT